MSFEARVFNILIASPADTRKYRTVAQRVVENWNALHAEAMRVVLIPRLWERDARPDSGDRPQAILNRQLGDQADAVVAVFWAKLGSATGEDESGTVEEIRRAMDDEKPVLVYFSDQPIERGSVDTDELDRLNQFESEIRDHVLYDEFNDESDFAEKLSRALTRVARDTFGATEGTEEEASGASGAVLTASVDVERDFVGFRKSGTARYRTRYTLEINNTGSATAEDLEIDFERSGDSADRAPLAVVGGSEVVERLVPGANVHFQLHVHMGTARQAELVMRWREGERKRQASQTIRLP